MDILISEQEVIELIEFFKMNPQHFDFVNLIDDIKDIPSAEPRWIPISERLPEEHEWIGTKTFGTTISDNVFVTLEATNGKRFTDYTRLQNGKLSLSKQAEWDAISKGIKLIAWMPSPEPYKAESEE